MDNDLLESDNESLDIDDEIIDFIPVPTTCSNRSNAIDSFYQCFQRRYDACPAFFMGTLRDACQEAFSPTQIQERRPVLIYIHNDESLLSKTFCKTILCSTMIIDYLLENYIVWPWDITFQSNRNTLTKIWEEMFSTQFFDDFSIEQSPLLIGIQRLFEYEINELTTSEYQFKSLLKGDILTRTQIPINQEMLLNELNNFKKECNENEEVLSFDFVRTTGLCWELILGIGKYLSLNDAVSVFSTKILPLLNNPQLNFQLSNSSISFIKMIRQKFQIEQIVSLEFKALRRNSKIELEFLSIFKKVVSITFLNLPYENQINQYEEYFPSLTCLSLWYDNEIDFNLFRKIFNQEWKRIKRLEIHSAGAFCTHDGTNQFNKLYYLNSSLEYFLFDVRHCPLISMNNCFGHHESCFLITTIDFIRKMWYIRSVHLIINKYDIEQFLDVNKWQILVNECSQLKKIISEASGSIFQNEQFIQKAQEIQMELRLIRETIKFQIRFL